MRSDLDVRRVLMAGYIIENRATVRGTADVFSISKSSVHKDMTEKLPNIAPILAKEVREILNFNKAERHIRGGESTKRKFKERKTVKD